MVSSATASYICTLLNLKWPRCPHLHLAVGGAGVYNGRGGGRGVVRRGSERRREKHWENSGMRVKGAVGGGELGRREGQ